MSNNPEKTRPTPSRVTVLSSRAIVIGGVILALIAAGVVWLLLAVGVGADQLDAIRTGGTLVVGAGGAVALLLAARRQRSTELELQQKYEAAHDARIDATERRITELYIKAADQLGSDKAPVRLAGLHALERLAQDTPHLRQTIVNVICAYLRMPYALPTTTPDRSPDPTDTARQEREVRLTAQGVLRAHLAPGPDRGNPVDEFWAGMNLDLTEATLVDLDLSRCVMSTGRFRGAHFVGDAEFTVATFLGDTTFSGAQFAGHSTFDEVTFAGDPEFEHATFTRTVTFSGARFAENATFDHTTFIRAAVFERVRFAGTTTFDRVKFANDSWFDRAEFAGIVRFSGTEFVGLATFHHACFAEDAWFGRRGTAWLAKFGVQELENMLLAEQWTHGFHDATFTEGAAFGGARFSGLAGFSGGQFTGDGTFAGARFALGVPAEVVKLALPDPST